MEYHNLKKTFLFLMSIFSLTACSKIIDIVTDTETTIADTSLPIVENATELPIISVENNLDERTLIENVINDQRELYKLGFITHSFTNMNTSIVYYPLNDTFGYSATYIIPNTQTSFTFEAGTSFNHSHYDSIVDQLAIKQHINNPYVPLLYGKYHDELAEDYHIAGQDNDTTYMLQIGSEEEGFSEEIVRLIGESLRTEAKGAFDPMYDHFSVPLEHIKLPSLNEQRVAIQDIHLSINTIHDTSDIFITYLLSEEDTITYQIQDTEPLLEKATNKGDTITLKDGTKVKQFERKSKEQIFQWYDETNYYTMTVALKDTTIIQPDEIIEIIESAHKDTRTFNDEQFFQPMSEYPKETGPDKQLVDMLENMNK